MQEEEKKGERKGRGKSRGEEERKGGGKKQGGRRVFLKNHKSHENERISQGKIENITFFFACGALKIETRSVSENKKYYVWKKHQTTLENMKNCRRRRP